MSKPKTAARIAAAIEGLELQKGRLDGQIAELRAMLPGGSNGTAATPEAATRKRKKFSAASRRKIAMAQKARWAKIRGESESSAASPELTKPKRKLSAAGRKAIQEALRKRWALKRHNARRSCAASVEEIDPVLFDEIFHLNVLGPIVAMQAVIPLMRAQGGGSIVNINSGTAFMTVPQYSIYSSSKRALLGFSLTARAELEKDRIVVSEIYPFIGATNFGTNRMVNPAGGGPASNYAEGDKPEFVAGLVLQAIEEGQAQYFANDRLRKMAGAAA